MKLLNQIRNAPTPHAKIALASGKAVGTPYDSIFSQCNFALEMLATKQQGDPAFTVAKQIIESVGTQFARCIKRRDSHELRRVADALDEWKQFERKGKPHQIRACLVEGFEMLRLGQKIRVRDVERNLRNRGVPINENTRKHIRNIAKDLGYPLDPTRKPPSRKPTGTKPRKKPG